MADTGKTIGLIKALASVDPEAIKSSVDDWLDDHPEATTTVQDGSLTYKKLVNGTLGYVTPEMFGAKGDGETDDTIAIQACINFGLPIIGFDKTYKITALNASDTIIYNCNFKIDSNDQGGRAISISTGKSLHLENCTFTSQNDIEIDTEYANGYTSNIVFIYASYGAKEIIINSCKFTNGYCDINVQGTDNYTTEKVYVNNSESTDAYTSIVISYCPDIKIKDSKFYQNVGAKKLSHIIYISSGDTNVLRVDGCYFNAHSEAVIHCFHGTNYKTYITNSEINTDQYYALLSGGTDDLMIIDSCKITGNRIAAISYDCKYKFLNCIIKSPVNVIAGNAGDGSAEFINCDISTAQLSTIGISCKSCNIFLNADSSVIFAGTGLLLYQCSFKYTCTNANPIRLQGNSKILKCIFENSETTQYAWYTTGDGNVIKDNVLINIPNNASGLSTQDNLFV